MTMVTVRRRRLSMRDGADGLAPEHVAGKSGSYSSNARAHFGSLDHKLVSNAWSLLRI